MTIDSLYRNVDAILGKPYDREAFINAIKEHPDDRDDLLDHEELRKLVDDSTLEPGLTEREALDEKVRRVLVKWLEEQSHLTDLQKWNLGRYCEEQHGLDLKMEYKPKFAIHKWEA